MAYMERLIDRDRDFVEIDVILCFRRCYTVGERGGLPKTDAVLHNLTMKQAFVNFTDLLFNNMRYFMRTDSTGNGSKGEDGLKKICDINKLMED